MVTDISRILHMRVCVMRVCVLALARVRDLGNIRHIRHHSRKTALGAVLRVTDMVLNPSPIRHHPSPL